MGMSRSGACDGCGLRWRERVPGELCPVCSIRGRIREVEAALAQRDARIAELEKALVFALRAGAYLTQKGDEIYYETGPVTGEWKRTVGTDSDLIRVMLAAAKGERCAHCNNPTGRAGRGDDSLYGSSGKGPYCEPCYELVCDTEVMHSRYVDAEARIARLRAENEALRADVVWAVRNRAHMIFLDSMLSFATHDGRLQGTEKTDGTDAAIRRAVREARTR